MSEYGEKILSKALSQEECERIWAIEERGLEVLKKILERSKMNYDNVNHPSHYNSGKIEVIEFIEDQKLGMHLGNAIKYIARAGKKDQTKLAEDLNKAVWYIERYLELQKPNPRRPNDMNNDLPPVGMSYNPAYIKE